MNVYAISDLHLSINNPKPMDIFGEVWDDYLEKITESWQQCVKDDDIVLIAGDISWAMTLENAIPDINLIAGLNGQKIIIRGNHDYWWKSISGVRSILPPSFYALQNDCIRINNLLFCGTRGWTMDNASADDKKIYARELLRLQMSLTAMEKQRTENDTVIALIHYPPFDARASNSEFTDMFNKFRVNKVVYGHLHGKYIRSMPIVNKGITDYYLTSCDQVKNTLVRIL